MIEATLSGEFFLELELRARRDEAVAFASAQALTADLGQRPRWRRRLPVGRWLRGRASLGDVATAAR